MDLVTLGIGLVIGAVLGGVAGFVIWGVKSNVSLKELEVGRAELLAEREKAAREAAEIRKKAEEEAEKHASRKRQDLEKELRKQREEVDRIEGRLKKRESQLDRRDETLLKREESLADKEKDADSHLQKAKSISEKAEEYRLDLMKRCEEVAQMSREEGKALLLRELEKDVRVDAANLVHQIEQETKAIAEKKARQLITLALQRCASDQVSETTVSVVDLPNDEMKGKVIGREGRNIRALEQATGVNIIVDDTPATIILSCFDPMRREIARLVLEKLLVDGRIHPGRIEELVEKTEKEVLEAAKEAGERACIELQIYDIHPELVKLMGRLKYRTSYGQNVLDHSIECARIGTVLADELGLDPKLVKRSCFLHDIGKALTYEIEGPHAAIGANVAKKHRERPEVIHAIEAHHYEVEPKTLTAILVITADAISASRPGARRESFESYIKRLEALEKISSGFDGVEKAYAIQAGREVRIIVEPSKLSDEECSLLARNVTKKIEAELEYPGQIKVTVLRETRQVEYAK